MVRGFWGGMVIGIALGTAGGLLFAPRNGRETRRVLQNSLDSLPNVTEDAVDGFQVDANRLIEQTRRKLDQTLDRLREAMEAGKKASHEYKAAAVPVIPPPDPPTLTSP